MAQKNANINRYMRLAPEAQLEGRNPIVEAVKAGRELKMVWYLDPGHKNMDSRLENILNLIQENSSATLIPVDRHSLDKMSSTYNHQGIVAEIEPREYVSIYDILDIAKARDEKPFIMILDEVQDSQNLGAILRTADAAGVHGVIIPERRSASLDAAAAKTSAGAIEYVACAKVTNISQTISELKELGLWIGGLDMDAENIFTTNHLTYPIALVVGNEAKGVSRNVKENCDFLLEIPMVGEINSLNASNAAAIAMYTVYQKRHIE